MNLIVTSATAVASGALMLALWAMVTKRRAAAHISIGEGGDVALHEWVRRHGNFIEWMPMTLLLMALAEAQGAGQVWLWGACALAILGRMIHPFGLRADNAGHPARIVGNLGNIAALVILLVVVTAQMLA